ncbi:MAG: tetratricopeptide repeat protein [Desulfobulbaceae bacterium]|nr:tetratricopeptide repeat protein [Desulfobulbaceae bacterium]
MTRPVTDSYTAMAAQDMIDADRASGNEKLEELPVDTLLTRADDYLQNDNFQLAKLHFGMALRKQPDSVRALTGIGLALAREGQDDKAMKPLQAALEVDNTYVAALLPLGKIMRSQSRFQEARQHLETAYKYAADNPAVLTELAITYDTMGVAKEAEPLFRRVVQLSPKQAAAHGNLGFNYFLQAKYPEAITSLAEALHLDKTNARVRNNLAAAYALTGEEERAFALLRDTVGEAGAYNDIGYIYMTSGNLDMAEKSFQRALAAAPRHYLRARRNLDALRQLRAEAKKTSP